MFKTWVATYTSRRTKKFLLARKYHPKVVQSAFGRVLAIQRSDDWKELQKTQEKMQDVMVIAFHPALPSISSVIHKHWRVMTANDSKLADCFVKPSIVACRRNTNLTDILVKAKIETKNKTRKWMGFQKCQRSCCVMCSFAVPSQKHNNYKGLINWIH